MEWRERKTEERRADETRKREMMNAGREYKRKREERELETMKKKEK